MDKTADRKRRLTQDVPRVEPIPEANWLSLGCTPLNLAVSGRKDGGIFKGCFLWYVGSSSTGKTLHALTMMAEAAINPNFKKYSYYYDNVEKGNYFDVAKWFPRLAGQIGPPPSHPKNKQVRRADSRTVEEFYYHLDAAARRGPFVYVLDSMDGLSGSVDEAKFQELLGAYGTEKKVKGSYGMAVAKYNSQNIKRSVSVLEDTGSVLLVINQTRSNVVEGPAAMFAPKERAGQGGYALKFYSRCELWATKRGVLKRSVMGKEREYGMRVNVSVEKNCVSGWEGDVLVAYARKVGIDETGTCIDYLVEEKHWRKNDKGVIDATEFKLKLPREKLASKVEDGGLADELREIVSFVWKEIDARVVVKRRNRYS